MKFNVGKLFTSSSENGRIIRRWFPLRFKQSFQIISNFNKWELASLENIIKSFTDDSSDAMEAISNMKANEIFLPWSRKTGYD